MTHPRDEIVETCSKFYNGDKILEAKRFHSKLLERLSSTVNFVMMKTQKTLSDIFDLITAQDNNVDESPVSVI